MFLTGNSVYTEENTQASTGSFGSNSEILNEDSNMSFPENSENTMPEYSQDSNDADPEMRVGEWSSSISYRKQVYFVFL